MPSRSRDRRRPASRSSIRTASPSLALRGCEIPARPRLRQRATTPSPERPRQARTGGAAVQALNEDKVLGQENHFEIGASVDRSKIRILGNNELGFIYPDLLVGLSAAIRGTEQILHTAANIGFSPVSLGAW